MWWISSIPMLIAHLDFRASIRECKGRFPVAGLRATVDANAQAQAIVVHPSDSASESLRQCKAKVCTLSRRLWPRKICHHLVIPLLSRASDKLFGSPSLWYTSSQQSASS